MAKEKTLQDFGGDEVAFAKYQEELKGTGSNSPKNEVHPAKETLKGVVISISDEPIKFKNGKYGRFLNISGEDQNILLSEQLYLSNQAYLKKGLRVECEVEKRVEGVTGYTDTNPESKTFGKWVLHTSSGIGFNKVKLNEEQAIASATMSLKTENSVQARKDLAKTVQSLVGDNPLAMATALQGIFAGI